MVLLLCHQLNTYWRSVMLYLRNWNSICTRPKIEWGLQPIENAVRNIMTWVTWCIWSSNAIVRNLLPSTVMRNCSHAIMDLFQLKLEWVQWRIGWPFHHPSCISCLATSQGSRHCSYISVFTTTINCRNGVTRWTNSYFGGASAPYRIYPCYWSSGAMERSSRFWGYLGKFCCYSESISGVPPCEQGGCLGGG